MDKTTEVPKYREIMLDLETMGQHNEAPIISIGAVKFNLDGQDTYEQLRDKDRIFYLQIPLKRSMDVGLKPDADTIVWWLKQSEEARAVFKPTGDEYLTTALVKFSVFMGASNNQDNSLFYIWGNGATFDNIILKSSYKAAALNVPWNFRYDMDMRTIVRLARKLVGHKNTIVFPGVKHNALDDAMYQVMVVQACYRAMMPRLDDVEPAQLTSQPITLNPEKTDFDTASSLLFEDDLAVKLTNNIAFKTDGTA